MLEIAEFCGFQPIEHWGCGERSFVNLQRI
jgi:hypothetical protein